MFPYGFPPGYNPSIGPGYNPHHPRPSTGPGQAAPTADATVSPARATRARLDGGQWISPNGEWIYHQRFGYWRAAWNGGGYGAWERIEELPEGTVKL